MWASTSGRASKLLHFSPWFSSLWLSAVSLLAPLSLRSTVLKNSRRLSLYISVSLCLSPCHMFVQILPLFDPVSLFKIKLLFRVLSSRLFRTTRCSLSLSSFFSFLVPLLSYFRIPPPSSFLELSCRSYLLLPPINDRLERSYSGF